MNFSAIYLGTKQRTGFEHLVEVFHPRKGIVSQYVSGTPLGDGRMMFKLDRGFGFQTYVLDHTEIGVPQVPGVAL